MSIDHSLTSTGVIIWHKAPYLVKLSSNKGDEVIVRIRDIVSQLTGLIAKHGVTETVIESLPYGLNSTSVRPLAALYHCIHNMCIDLGIQFYESHVTSVKKLATGSGKAKKEQMIEAFANADPILYQAVLESGLKKTTGLADIADAYWIGRLMKEIDG